MNNLIGILQAVSIVGALFCVGAYLYGFILKSKGDRKLHTASLLFTGIAIANAPALLVSTSRADLMVAKVNLVVFLLLSIGCQAFGAFRGRRSDRRQPREAAAPGGAQVVAAPAPERRAA